MTTTFGEANIACDLTDLPTTAAFRGPEASHPLKKLRKFRTPMPKKLALTILSFVLLLSASPIKADIMYTSVSAFDAAVNNPVTINFTAPSHATFSAFPTYTDAGTGTTFATATSTVNLTGDDFYLTPYPADFLVESATGFLVPNVLTVTPPTGISAVGFEIGSFNGGTFIVTLSDGTKFDITPPAFGNLGFFGFSSPSGISSISLSIPSNDTFVIDQAVIADVTPAPVPEPFSWILLLTVMLAVAIVKKSRRTDGLADPATRMRG